MLNESSEVPNPQSEGPQKFLPRLDATERDLVEAAVLGVALNAVQEVLPIIGKNFSPEVCADIICSAFKVAVEDDDARKGIIMWVSDLQSGKQDSDRKRILD